MKKIIKILIMLFLLFAFNASANDSLLLLGHTIIIDVGHGGLDAGTVVDNVKEKDVNLAITLKLQNIIEQNGGVAILIRNGDYDLASPLVKYRKKSDFNNRIKLINNSQADLYLSIHQNYLNDSSYWGPQVFYDKNNKKLASIMQETLNERLQSNRKIMPIPSNTYMYDKLEIKGILLECGFLSNPSERSLLQDSSYQTKLATTITEALIKYFN